jgi:hypothetical protein
MSAVPALVALGERLRARGHHALGTDLAHLGGDLASESSTLSVIGRLVVLVETIPAPLVVGSAPVETPRCSWCWSPRHRTADCADRRRAHG